MYDQIYNTSNEVVKSLKADLRLRNSLPLICCDFFFM